MTYIEKRPSPGMMRRVIFQAKPRPPMDHAHLLIEARSGTGVVSKFYICPVLPTCALARYVEQHLLIRKCEEHWLVISLTSST